MRKYSYFLNKNKQNLAHLVNTAKATAVGLQQKVKVMRNVRWRTANVPKREREKKGDRRGISRMHRQRDDNEERYRRDVIGAAATATWQRIVFYRTTRRQSSLVAPGARSYRDRTPRWSWLVSHSAFAKFSPRAARLSGNGAVFYFVSNRSIRWFVVCLSFFFVRRTLWVGGCRSFMGRFIGTRIASFKTWTDCESASYDIDQLFWWFLFLRTLRESFSLSLSLFPPPSTLCKWIWQLSQTLATSVRPYRVLPSFPSGGARAASSPSSKRTKK